MVWILKNSLKVFFLFLILGGLLAISVSARTCIPEQCNQAGEYEPDFNCVNRKLLDPTIDCCENKCVGSSSVDQPDEFNTLFEFFGTELQINSENQIPVLINLAITTFLGIASVYAAVYGVYIAGFVRAQATDEETITKANKTLVTLIAGFTLAWSFIVIIQLVANLLGLGNLSDLQLVGNDGDSSNITIN